MHFAQTIENGSVPEWRSRYVDYQRGKKLINKLYKSGGDGIKPGSDTGRRSNWDLPPPAIPQSPYSNHAGTSQLSQRAPTATPVTETSPLISPVRLYRTPHLDTPRETPSGSISMQNVHPDGQFDSQRAAFFAWLNREVAKVNAFYTEKEDEALIKMRMLEAQIRHFMEHKALHNKEKSRLGPHAGSFLQRIDLPSLPAIMRGRPAEQPARSVRTAHIRDFANNDDHVGYYQAKTMLRAAMIDYYQFLQQLKTFRNLNETAVRKIVKKFDKQLGFHTLDKYLEELKTMRVYKSTTLDDLIHRTEMIFANTFTRGNHKLAMEELTVSSLLSEDPHTLEVLCTGIFLGLALPLIILALYKALRDRPGAPWQITFLLQVWGNFLIVAGFFIGFGVNLAIWKKYRINYPFIIEFNRSTMLDYREYPVLPSLLVFGLALFGWLTFNTNQHFHLFYPCLFLGIATFCTIIPYGHFWNSRKWLLHSVWRLIFSGLYPVEFRDLLMGDIMCSLTNPLSTMELFFCVYSTDHWWSGAGAVHAQRCTSSHSRVLGFLNCLPGIWRFLQCLRRFADTLDWFPHLLNAGKYSFTILYYMSLSLARISPDNGGLKAMFITFALINGLYTALWDVFMDFSLSPFGLRKTLVFPRWTYWFVMVVDPVMRQNWVLYAAVWNQKEQGAKISYIVALIEAVRRVLWITFRVENEHTANISRCRAFKDLNLPYDDLEEAELTENQLRQSSQGTPVNIPHRASTFPFQSGSVPVTPLSLGMSPRVRFAHTNDFQRRKPKPFENG